MGDKSSTSPATDWVTVGTDDGPMRVFTARPAAADRAVVVFQEVFGVNDYIQDIARRFAGRGWLALAPSLFHRAGVETLPYDRLPEALELADATGPDAIVTDVRAVLTHLAEMEGIPVGRCVLVGFCFGGRVAFTAATGVDGLGATVVFYGSYIAAGPHAVLDRAASIDSPMMLHVGAEDHVITADQVQATENALRAAGADFVQHVYENAGHAFASDHRSQEYRPGPAETAWQRTWAFLDRHVPTPA
ncbi:hypothetical protein GCM10020221_20520 [Streptomyces thioluteus]|uniref:Dienelactone hydrolase domain-containing protein n=1 Tax=Streptomyces thioluteus TaxID=66431 RepID=A0ABN3WRM7_STRTU